MKRILKTRAKATASPNSKKKQRSGKTFAEKPFIGRLEGIITINGELTKPIIPWEDWDTEKFLRVSAPPRRK
jgi:hypothetical protein